MGLLNSRSAPALPVLALLKRPTVPVLLMLPALRQDQGLRRGRARLQGQEPKAQRPLYLSAPAPA